ncbi:MAG TPA: biotin--[acetyl-CoA-carboxylase] ligase, partial [Chloroflexota bacterium]|nr:biotin--[acetyl-CoA-carboxylase] ligase [Chloroflexota bacterium]
DDLHALDDSPLTLVQRNGMSGEHSDIGHTVWYAPSVSSTNRVLREMVERGDARHGTAVVAGVQTAGRGRLGRSWAASPGSGLLISVLMDPVEPRVTTCIVSLAVQDAIYSTAKQPSELKWPNDVLVGGLKVCGILVERFGFGAVVGIGINTNMEQVELDRIGAEATSLAVRSGSIIDHDALLDDLLIRLEERYRRSKSKPESVFQEWRSAIVTLGHTVEVETARDTWVGRAVDVASDGALLVTNDKRLVRVYAADVRIRSL